MQCVEDLRALVPDGEAGTIITSACHPGTPLVVAYNVASEALVLTCSACGQGVADVPVAPRRSLAQRKRRLTLVRTPTVVQKLDQAARKNRDRKK
jgi:hypothetical protein